MNQVARISIRIGVIAVVVVCLAFSLRFTDGPVPLMHGGPFRSGELVDYATVDWAALDEHRELELELVGLERSLLLWFSVWGGRPYVSCGFSCEEGAVGRWPSHLQADPRVVVRLEGRRVNARVEPVSPGSEEHAQAVARRQAKYRAAKDSGERARLEKWLHGLITEAGSSVADDEEEPPSGRMFRIVAP